MPDIWRPAPGWPDYYVSWNGKVVSGKTGIELKQGTDRNGYLRVHLRDRKRTRRARIHQLVAETFLGSCPQGLEVCHEDGDNTNNWLGNLSYGTREHNANQAVEHGTHRNTRKTHCPQGHEYTPENTVVEQPGWRKCLICRRARNKARWQRRLATR